MVSPIILMFLAQGVSRKRIRNRTKHFHDITTLKNHENICKSPTELVHPVDGEYFRCLPDVRFRSPSLKLA